MTRLMVETLESLAEAVITAEISQHFAGLNPLEAVETHEGVLLERAEMLGLTDLDAEDREAVAALIDTATVGVESVMSS